MSSTVVVEKEFKTPEESQEVVEKRNKKRLMALAKDNAVKVVKRMKEAEEAFEAAKGHLEKLNLPDLARFFAEMKEDLKQLREEASEVVDYELKPAADSILDEIDDTEDEVKPKKIVLVLEK